MIRRPSRGFTLIELLVVVLIVAMVMSIAVLSVTLVNDDRDLEAEARRLASLVSVVQDEAMMQGREFGLELMIGSYRFVEYDALSSQWVEVIGDDLLRLRTLPEGIEFDLSLEGQRVVLEMDPEDIRDPEDEENMSRDPIETFEPHIFIFSSGDATPFELTLTRVASQRSLPMESDLTGNIKIGADEDEG